MIKKLRNKFIGIAMLSISVVLLFIIGGINIVNHVRTYNSIDMRMEFVAYDREHPDKPMGEHGGDFEPGTKPELEFGKNLNKEAFFDTRFFYVLMDEKGELLEVNTERISAIDEETALSFANHIKENGKSKGNYRIYRYEKMRLQDGSVKYLFLDIEREQTSLRQYLFVSILISVLGLLLVFVMVFVLSKRIMKPVTESYEKQKRFITDASHELKTPLTIIDANTEVLEMVHGEDEWTRSTRKQVKRLASLTEKLVFLSRMDEENNSCMEMLEFDLSEALLDTAETFTSVAATKGLRFEIDVQEAVKYRGDEASIRRMTSLLLDNAMKYTSLEGEVKLQLTTSGKNRILTFWNTTDQMEQGKWDVIFERFYRRESSHNSATGGFGIGLSVVAAIVQAHKGKISAKSEDGKSLKIVIIL